MMASVVPPCLQGVGVRSSPGVVSVADDDVEARVARAHETLLAALTEIHQAIDGESSRRATSAVVIVEVTDFGGADVTDDRWFSWWSPDMKAATRIGLLTMTLDTARTCANADGVE